MTEHEAPERIWAWRWAGKAFEGAWLAQPTHGSTEYVRATLHAQALAERDEARAQRNASERNREKMLEILEKMEANRDEWKARAEAAEAALVEARRAARVVEAARRVSEIDADLRDFDGDRRGHLFALEDAHEELAAALRALAQPEESPK